MSAIVSTIDIDRPPGEVFDYATDPSRFVEWQKDVAGGREEGPSGVGSRCITTRRIGGRVRSSTQVVEVYEPPRRWAVRGIDGPVRANVNVAVMPLREGRSSRITIGLDFEGRGIGRVIVPLFVTREARRTVPESCRHLKERLEARGPAVLAETGS